MNKIIIILCLFFTNTIFAFDTSKIIKVTPNMTGNCVEYYNYQGTAYCSTTPLSTEPADPKIKDMEKQTIFFDDRPWQAVWGKSTPNITTIEYVPAGDNINSWNELVTSQFIPSMDKKYTAKEYFETFNSKLKETKLNPIVTVLEQTPDMVIFEFRVETPANMAQDEIQKVVSSTDGIYILHYVTKKADMGQENRTKWLGLLKQSSITQ